MKFDPLIKTKKHKTTNTIDMILFSNKMKNIHFLNRRLYFKKINK